MVLYGILVIIFNIIVSILVIITLCFIIYYIVDTKLRLEKSKQYIAQIVEHKAELERIQKEEAERKAKIPQLTEQGKENLKNILGFVLSKIYHRKKFQTR